METGFGFAAVIARSRISRSYMERARIAEGCVSKMEDRVRIYSTLVFVLIIVISFVSSGLPRLKAKLKGRRSANWQLAKAKYEHGDISYALVDGSRIPYLKVDFTYNVSGKRYEGQFEFRGEGEHLARSLKNGPFIIRYNPDAPEEYFVDPYRDVRM
jgi:hypothetical protein